MAESVGAYAHMSHIYAHGSFSQHNDWAVINGSCSLITNMNQWVMWPLWRAITSHWSCYREVRLCCKDLVKRLLVGGRKGFLYGHPAPAASWDIWHGASTEASHCWRSADPAALRQSKNPEQTVFSWWKNSEDGNRDLVCSSIEGRITTGQLWICWAWR